MKWPVEQVGAVARVNPRLDVASRPAADDLVSFVPMAAVSEKTLRIEIHSERPFLEVSKGYTPFRRGDVLIAKITPCFENGKMTLTDDLPHGFGFGTTEFHVLRPSERITGAYLFCLLRSPYVRAAGATKMKGAAGQRRVPADFLASLQIPLPPLPEQKRIAQILDAADALRAKRRVSLVQLDALLQSTFLEMFGDPASNPMGWEAKPLSHGVALFEGGRNLLPTDTERSDRVRVLKVSVVTSGEYRPQESKPFSNDADVPAAHIVKKGDLLISRANTSALVGAVCHVWGTGGREMLPDKLWRFVWSRPQRIEPLFMLHMARSDYFREQLIQRATGTSGSMKNIGKRKMLEIPIPCPPLDLQRRFAAIVASVEKQKAHQRAHLAELDTLFASLQSRAFRGEL